MTDVRARTSTGARNGLRYLLYGFGLLLALLTASCGNGIFSVGTPVITMTSKPGRFSSYIVTIDEVQLTRDDGAVVTLPAFSQRVDLANLSANYNLLEAPAVAVGTYVAATFVLDYSAETPVVTVDYQGHSYATSLTDFTTKAAPTTETIEVKFDPNHPFVIADQQASALAIDIDLEASNIIGPGNAGVFPVRVKPFWNVNANPTYNEKPVFARGLYVLADKTNNNFVMNVRPLHDLVDSPFGALKVGVDNNTYWSVNGTVYTGPAGLAALAALQNIYADLQIAAYGPPTASPFTNLGTAQSITPTFTATQVYVGSSLESTIEDQVTGFVSAISGNTLTVARASSVDHAGNFGFTETLPVTVGPNTIVGIDGVNTGSAVPLSAISVGQVITVQGVANEPGFYNTVPDFTFTALDATGGVISGPVLRIQNTPLIGTLNSATSNSLSLNLLQIDHTELADVHFAGTGTSSSADATAGNYLVTTQTDVSSQPAGTLLKLEGMMTAFGQGPPYFNATSITTPLQQQLVIEWTSTAGNTGAGSITPFSVVNQYGLAVPLNNASLQPSSDGTYGTAIIRTGPTCTYDLIGTQVANGCPSTPPPNPSLLVINYNTADPQHPPLFGVGSVGVGAYNDTDTQGFANEIQIVANGTEAVQKLVAYGQYDPTTGTFNATNITINAQ